MCRVVPAIAVTIAVLLAAALYASGHHEQYYALLTNWGAAPFREPFLDMQGVTAAIECHRLGIDVYVRNPCDVFNRVHAYSPLWLWLSVLPITTAWDNALGLASAALFILALLLLPPGRGWPQTVLIAIATISSATMFALERANVDLLMFVLATLAVVLTRGGVWARATGYAVALLAGMLKFYPIVLLILALRERRVVCAAIIVAALAIIAGWFALEGPDILRGIANIPSFQPFDLTMFGSRNLPTGLAALFGVPRAVAVGLRVVLTLVMLLVTAAIAWRIRLDELTDAEQAFLLIGCALWVSCFLIAQNVNYRAIYFLFVLPALTALGRRWWFVTWLVVLLMWSPALRLAPTSPLFLSAWLARELAWWLVMTVLFAVLLRQSVYASPASGRGCW